MGVGRVLPAKYADASGYLGPPTRSRALSRPSGRCVSASRLRHKGIKVLLSVCLS